MPNARQYIICDAAGKPIWAGIAVDYDDALERMRSLTGVTFDNQSMTIHSEPTDLVIAGTINF